MTELWISNASIHCINCGSAGVLLEENNADLEVGHCHVCPKCRTMWHMWGEDASVSIERLAEIVALAEGNNA